LVEILHYKLEDRGIDSPMMSLELFIDVILLVAPLPRVSTESLTDMISRNISCGVNAAGV